MHECEGVEATRKIQSRTKALQMRNVFQGIRIGKRFETTQPMGARTKALKALQMQNVFQDIRVRELSQGP